MTPLEKSLARRIAATGPVTVADYMAECLLHPEHGYYTTREPFGTRGDFVTAPEISQMFGELIGLALAQGWADQGCPRPFTLAEVGPGRGTLMADALRATRVVPGFIEAAVVHLVEASARLRAVQHETLAGWPVFWHDRVESLPAQPLFLIANEFFDALPVRQFVRAPGGWRERVVGLDGGRLVFGLSDAVPLAALAHRVGDTREGDLVELCPAAGPLLAEIAGRIARHGGGALIIDYGAGPSLGDTLQAMHRQAPDDPLAHPGAADLTAHVDFTALAEAARTVAGIRVCGPVPQGRFLERLGIAARARKLARGLSGAARESHLAAYRRLTHPSEMGTLFKTLAVTPGSAPPLAGMPAAPGNDLGTETMTAETATDPPPTPGR